MWSLVWFGLLVALGITSEVVFACTSWVARTPDEVGTVWSFVSVDEGFHLRCLVVLAIWTRDNHINMCQWIRLISNLVSRKWKGFREHKVEWLQLHPFWTVVCGQIVVAISLYICTLFDQGLICCNPCFVIFPTISHTPPVTIGARRNLSQNFGCVPCTVSSFLRILDWELSFSKSIFVDLACSSYVSADFWLVRFIIICGNFYRVFSDLMFNYQFNQ